MIHTASKEGPQPPVETVRPRHGTVVFVATAAGGNTSRKQRNGTKTEEHLGLVLIRGGTFVRRRTKGETAQAGAEIVWSRGRWHRGGFLHREACFHHRFQKVYEQLRRFDHHIVLSEGSCKTPQSSETTTLQKVQRLLAGVFTC